MRWKTALAVSVASVVSALAVQRVALAWDPATNVTVLLPTSGNLPEPPGGPNDKLIYTGGRITNVTVDHSTGDTCDQGTFAVQNSVLVDPAGGRSSRIVGVITVEPAEAADPGTRLGSLSGGGTTCEIDGIQYAVFTGKVE